MNNKSLTNKDDLEISFKTGKFNECRSIDS